MIGSRHGPLTRLTSFTADYTRCRCGLVNGLVLEKQMPGLVPGMQVTRFHDLASKATRPATSGRPKGNPSTLAHDCYLLLYATA